MQYEVNKKEIPKILEEIMSKMMTNVPEDQNKIAVDFVNLLKQKHRTQQQLIIKLLSNIIKKYSNAPFDKRNRDSVIWAKAVSTFNNNFDYI